MKKRRVNLKELMKKKDSKGYFRSKGYSTIKHTYINDQGKQESELLEFEIRPLGSHPLIKEYTEKFPEPEAPIKRQLIHPDTGKDVTQAGVSPKEAKAQGFTWSDVPDYADKEYKELRDEYMKNIRLLQLMIVFELEDEFGIDKVEEFEKQLDELGFTSNQLNKIGEDIKNLDFFTGNEN